MAVKENHLDDVSARSKQLIEAKFVFNTKEDAFIKKVQGKTYYMPVLDIQTMSDADFNPLVAEAAESDSIGGEIEQTEQVASNELTASDPAVVQVLELQHQLAELTANPTFAYAFKLQKELNDRIKAGEKTLAGMMVLAHKKKLDGEWGYITLVERDSFNGDIDVLDPKFVRPAPDVKMIGDHYKLTGKLPEGATIKSSIFLRKSIK